MKKTIEKDLSPFFETVLKKYDINYSMDTTTDESGEEQVFLTADFEDEEFIIYEEYALCVQQQGNKRTPVVPLRLVIDGGERREKRDRLPQGCYTILKRDQEAAMEYFKNR